MPSPTATMRPTSAATRLASKSFSRSLMTSEISFVLMPTFLLLRGRQPAAQLLQPGGDARIHDPVAVLQLQSAKDAGVDDDGQPDVLAQPLRKLPLDAVPVLTWQLDRGRHGRADAARRLIREPLILVVDLRCLLDTARLDEQAGVVDALLVEEVGRRGDEAFALLGRDRGVGQNGGDHRVGEQLADTGEPARPLLYVALLLGQLEDGPGVASSPGRRHSPPPRSPSGSACGAWCRRASLR